MVKKTHRTDKAQIALQSQFSEVDEKRLEELRSVAAAKSPKEEAARLRRAKVRVSQMATNTRQLSAVLSTTSLQNLNVLRRASVAADMAAEIASKKSLGDEPVTGTGSDAWRLLFDAARQFSESVAYPEEAFPVTREDASCVWCQQPLTQSARDRLKRFDEYVKNEAARAKDVASNALRKALAVIAGANYNAVDEEASLDELKTLNSTLAENLVAHYLKAKAIRDAVNESLSAARDVNEDGLPEEIVGQIEEVAAVLESQAVAFEKADQPEERKKLLMELAELQDRQRLKLHADAATRFVELKVREANLKKCQKALDTAPITRRGSELMEESVTEQLAASLKRELAGFGVECPPVQVKKIGERGKTKHRLTISVSESAKPSCVLSEGEQRIIAICSFLAELETADSKSPVIFDDPVSSLDHRFREKVARRLVAEGKRRQVVVFTHDVVMLLALEREAGEQQTDLLIQTISKSPTGPGQCASPRPWHTCTVKERIGVMRNLTAPFKKLSVDNPAEYVGRVADVYGRLRETWERLIEELLFQEVVLRFRPGIETQRLKRVTIEADDLLTIEDGMSKCSRCLTGHDSAAAIGSPPPTPDEIASDIAGIEKFSQDLRARGEKAAKEIKEIVAAPVAKTSNERAAAVVTL